jgi:hypothetical protein
MALPRLLRELDVRLRIGRRLSRRGRKFKLPHADLQFSREPTPYHFDCEFERRSGRYTVTFIGDQIEFIAGYNLIPAALYWFSLCPDKITSIRVNLSDGEAASAAPFAYCTNLPHVIVLPDRDFFSSRGFEHFRAHALANGVEWSRRSDRVRWRGWTNGGGSKDYSSPQARWDPKVLARIRMALILKDAGNSDVAFTGSFNRNLADRLRADGLLKDPIPQGDWINDKLALDIDGTTNTWVNFLVRMHLGCCVLKVESQEGYRQWYYDRIRPWEHFVPVRPDMSDLIEKIEWARSHDSEAKTIARNGQVFARSMTFESETDFAIKAICAANGVLLG